MHRQLGPIVALGLLAATSLLGCATRQLAPGDAAPAGSELQLASFDHAWQRVAETHPLEDMGGLDWEAVRDELRPAAARATRASELRPVLGQMLARLGDSHYGVLPGTDSDLSFQVARARRSRMAVGRPQWRLEPAPITLDSLGQGDLGLSCHLVGDEVLVTRVSPDGPAHQAGVLPGFVVERIDGQSVRGVLGALSEMGLTGSALHLRLQTLLTEALEGLPGTTVDLALIDQVGGLRRLSLKREPSQQQVVSFGHLTSLPVETESRVLDAGVGYVRFNIFMPAIVGPFNEAIQGFIDRRSPGVVLDLRGNPGGVGAMVMGLAGRFVAERGKSLGTMQTRETQLRFFANPRARSERFEGPVAILVDDLSASTSEIFAGGLQEMGRVRVFGLRSAGMALPSLVEELPNGDRLQFVTADFTTPGGRRLEGQGVEPDAVVPHSREHLLSGEDAALSAAVAWILAQQGASS
ncbi:MAG: S41 family peptidase [Acidobacteriota bacterium]